MINPEFAKKLTPLVTLVALGGCASGANSIHENSSDEKELVYNLYITGNTRHDPIVIATADGESNKCFSEDYSIDSTTVTITQGDNNGPWYGVPAESLPKEVAESCKNDTDDIVWITTNYAEPKS